MLAKLEEFTAGGVRKAATAFLATMELVTDEGEGYHPLVNELEDEEMQHTQSEVVSAVGVSRAPAARGQAQAAVEREFLRSQVSPDSIIRILVSGPIGAKELKKLRHLVYIHELWQSLENDERSDLLEQIDKESESA